MAVNLRDYLRAKMNYRMEYGPFPLSGRTGELKHTTVMDIGGGGLLFRSSEELAAGRQIVIKIFLAGWREENNDLVEDVDSEALLTAIAEVRRSEFDQNKQCYLTAVQFLGRILNQ
jgi:hypothetical protein